MPYFPYPSLVPSQEFASGLSDTEEKRLRESSAYMARRDLFSTGVAMERSEHFSRKETMRETAERISLNKRVSGAMLAAFRSYRKTDHYYLCITEH